MKMRCMTLTKGGLSSWAVDRLVFNMQWTLETTLVLVKEYFILSFWTLNRHFRLLEVFMLQTSITSLEIGLKSIVNFFLVSPCTVRLAQSLADCIVHSSHVLKWKWPVKISLCISGSCWTVVHFWKYETLHVLHVNNMYVMSATCLSNFNNITVELLEYSTLKCKWNELIYFTVKS